MEEKKHVFEFDDIEIGFILRCLYIGSLAYDVINGDLVISKALERITEKFYEVVHNDAR